MERDQNVEHRLNALGSASTSSSSSSCSSSCTLQPKSRIKNATSLVILTSREEAGKTSRIFLHEVPQRVELSKRISADPVKSNYYPKTGLLFPANVYRAYKSILPASY